MDGRLDYVGIVDESIGLWRKEDPIIEDTGVQTVTEDCTDGVDNDGDGYIDCEDAECLSDDACELVEDCTDSIDNDGDGLVDCDDPDCEESDDCVIEPEQTVPTESMMMVMVILTVLILTVLEMQPVLKLDCADGADNDGDGTIDCDDADCIDSADCVGQVESDCTDGLDDDGDGAVDCDDSDCAGSSDCISTGAENCADGFDNDGDGASDCDDTDCAQNSCCTIGNYRSAIVQMGLTMMEMVKRIVMINYVRS